MRTRVRQRRRLSRKTRRRHDAVESTGEVAVEIQSSLGNAAVQRLLRSREPSAALQREDGELEPEVPSTPVPLPMKLGHQNWAVAVLQAVLNQILPEEAPVLVLDRVFGPRTDAAVRFIQWSAELEIDGMVGDETGDAIKKAGANTPEAIEEVREVGLLF